MTFVTNFGSGREVPYEPLRGLGRPGVPRPTPEPPSGLLRGLQPRMGALPRFGWKQERDPLRGPLW